MAAVLDGKLHFLSLQDLYIRRPQGAPSSLRGHKMRTEGIGNSARKLLLLSALLLFCRPLFAQRAFTMLPPWNANDGDPIAFMRPHYVLHQTTDSNLASPPTTAFAPAQIRRAYGFDRVSNEGARQVIGIVDAYDDPKAEADLGVFSKQVWFARLHHRKWMLSQSLRQRPACGEPQLGRRDFARCPVGACNSSASHHSIGRSQIQ